MQILSPRIDSLLLDIEIFYQCFIGRILKRGPAFRDLFRTSKEITSFLPNLFLK